MRTTGARLAVAAAAALLLSLVAYWLVGDTLDPGLQTDIVGYPTFADFNIYGYFWKYALVVIVFPLATLGAYVGLSRLLVGRPDTGPRPGPAGEIEAVPDIVGWRVWPVTLGRTLFVGLALGLETAIWLDGGYGVTLAAAATYCAVVALVGWIGTRLGEHAVRTMAAANTLATPCLVVGLYGVSRSTRITVESTGAEHPYSWLPPWLAFGAAAALLVFLVVYLVRDQWRLRVGSLERGVLLLVVAPIVLFVFVADLPGQLGTLDLYEEGQILAAAELTREGAFPWRDLLVAHGLLHDVGQGLVGFGLFEDSRWGLVSGQDVLLFPIAWLTVYYLAAYLLWANWLVLAGAQLLIVTGHVSEVQIRFLVLPVVLLLLAALLQRATLPRAVAFTAALVIQTIVTPEAIVAVVAYVGTLAAFEAYYYERGTGLARGFRRLLYCGATALCLGACWLAFLGANHTLDDWFFSFAATIPGHQLTGGIPILVSRREFEIVATGVLLLSVFAFVVARTRMRRPLAYRDWIMIALAGVSALYFTKFLGRADRYHLDQSFSVTVPLLFYVGYRAITFAEAYIASVGRARGVGWAPRRHTVTIPLLVVLLAIAPAGLGAVTSAPQHFEARVETEPAVERIGHSRPDENDPEVIRDLSRTLDGLLEPGQTVFDFANAPGLFHYLLDQTSPTRYYHVSMAIRQRTQSDLVRQLERRSPGVVVLTSNDVPTSVSTWDGVANQVRHYDVSEYLLDRYVPVVEAAGFVLARPRADGVRADPSLYFRVEPCDWGYVPNFFAPAPAEGSRSVKLPFRRSADGTRLAVTLPPDATEYGWLELRTGTPVGAARFELTDRPGGAEERSIAWNTLERGRNTTRVKVGACSQWRGYEPGVVYLTSDVAQDVDRVRLIR